MSNSNQSNFGQAMWLGLGQLCTFALSFVSAAILARYFDKTEYGTYKQILYVYNTLFTLFTVGLPNVFAYFIPRMNCGQQKTLVSSLNKLFLVLGGLFSLSLFLLADVIANILNNPELANGIRIFSPFPLFTLPTMGVEGIYTALRKTKYLAIYQVLSRVLMLICIITPVVFFNAGYEAAIIGWGIASFMIFLMAMYMKSRPYFCVKKDIVPNFYRQVFDYCLPLVGAFVAGFFISAADQFFISYYFGTKIFAEASNGLMSIPIAVMVSGSVRSVLLPLFSKADSEGTMSEMIVTYNNAVKKCVVIVFPILLFFFFYAKDAMSLLYGSQYEVSGKYLQVYMVRDFITCLPYFSVLMAIGATKFYLYMHIVGVACLWTLDYMLAMCCQSAVSFVCISSAFYMISSITAFVFIYKRTGVNLLNHKILVNIFKVLLHCCMLLFAVRLVTNLVENDFGILFTTAISAVAFYALLILTGKVVGVDYLESLKLLRRR